MGPIPGGLYQFATQRFGVLICDTSRCLPHGNSKSHHGRFTADGLHGALPWPGQGGTAVLEKSPIAYV